MQAANTTTYQFEIAYYNRQGTLMRILGIVTRRGLELPYVHAETSGDMHKVTLRATVNPKQLGQLCREWSVTPDVVEIREPIRVLGTWNAFRRARGKVSARMRGLARAESPRQPWRAALARLFAFVPSR
jgi:acetolactate synthase regulatory subunit